MRNNLKTWKIFVNRADLIQASHWVARGVPCPRFSNRRKDYFERGRRRRFQFIDPHISPCVSFRESRQRFEYFDDGNDDIPTYSDSSLSTPFVSRLCEWYVARFPGTKCEVISLHRANRVNLATHRLNAAAGGVVEATAYRSYRFAPIDLTARVSPLHADRNWQAARHPKPPLEKPLLRPRVRSTDRSRTTHCYEIPSATTDYRSLLFLDCVLFMGLFILICVSFSLAIN